MGAHSDQNSAAAAPGRRRRREAPWAPGGIDEGNIWVAVAAAMAASLALSLWLGRGTSFSIDEIRIFGDSAHLDLQGSLHPFNGHLVVSSRLVNAAILNLFGSEYLPFRILTIASLLMTAGLFFVFAKRSVGSTAAFAPTLVLLFYGSDAPHVILGNGFGIFLALAAGLGALLALDRGDLRGDVCACLLLCLSLATYSIALPFVAGAAVLIMIGRNRWHRVWVFVVPVALYAAWLLWSRSQAGSTEGSIHLSNLLLAPNWSLNSLASVGAALLGLNYPAFGSGWGPAIAVAALVGLGWRLSRGNIPRWLWATMAVLATLWLMGAAAALPPVRVPYKSEYMFPATIAVLLVAVEAARGVRLRRGGMTILYAATAISLATNIALLRDGSRKFRAATTSIRTSLTISELASAAGRPPSGYANYLDAVRQFGSPAFSPATLRTQSEATRDQVDDDLAGRLGLQLQLGSAPAAPCQSVAGGPGRPVSFELPPAGVALKASGPAGPVLLRRFGSAFTAQVGQLPSDTWMMLRVPRDSAPDPWYGLTTVNAGSVEVCALS